MLIAWEQRAAAISSRRLRKRLPPWMRKLSSTIPLSLPPWLTRHVPEPWQKPLAQVTLRKLTLFTNVILLLGLVGLVGLLLSQCGKKPPPSEAAPVEMPRSSGMLWDAKKAREDLRLPEIPKLPSQVATDYKELSARTRAITLEHGREAALADAERQALISPDLSSVQHHAGMLALGLGQRDKARRYFEAALRADPHAPGSLFNLAQMDFRDERFAEAAELYRRINRLHTLTPVGQFRLFLCRLHLGESVELEQIDLPAGSLPGLYARAVLALQQGDEETAGELLRTARERFPGQTNIYDTDTTRAFQLLKAQPQD